MQVDDVRTTTSSTASIEQPSRANVFASVIPGPTAAALAAG
jgi:hypothetical protein